MAHGQYLNLEILILEIINEQIELMEESNTALLNDGFEIYDETKLVINYKRGYLIVTMMVSLVECFLNGLINQKFVNDNERLLNSSMEEKIDFLYLNSGKSTRTLRGSHLYSEYKNINKIRNELIHYKNNFVGNSTMLLSTKIGKLDLGSIFTKKNMAESLEYINGFTQKIANDLGFQIDYNISAITSDAKGDNYLFAFTQNSFDENLVYDMKPQININLLLPANHYNLDYSKEIITVNEEVFNYLQCFDVKLSTKYEPSCIDSGEIWIDIACFIESIRNNPLINNIFSNVIYDIVKFLSNKLGLIIKSNKLSQEKVYVNLSTSISDKKNTEIEFYVGADSEQICDIMTSLVNIHELIKDTDLGKVQIHYDYENNKWEVRN